MHCLCLVDYLHVYLLRTQVTDLYRLKHIL